MAVEGIVQQVIYRTTATGLFYALPAEAVLVELNSIFQLGITWQNTSDAAFQGHIGLVITKPDGTTVTPDAVMNQDVLVDPDSSATVLFEAVTLDQYGTYTAQATLTETDETEILDLQTFLFATVVEPVSVGFDISLIIPIVGLAMVAMMLTTMMKGMFSMK